MQIESYATHSRDIVRPIGVRGLARSTILSWLALAKRKSAKTFLRCLYCHYVLDDQVEKFSRIISSLKNDGEFVDSDTCLDMLHGKRPIDGRYFHLSFDDGFRNNFLNARPVLMEHNVPAIFFVPSELVSADWPTARQYCRDTTSYRATMEVMTWDDLNQMLADGFEIGSHTRTHTRFSAISGDPKLMDSEIRGSKQDLERRLNTECKYISWPYGTRADADGASLSVVADSGYAACFGAFRGTVRVGETNVFAIPRHHFEVEWPLQHILYFARGNHENQ